MKTLLAVFLLATILALHANADGITLNSGGDLLLTSGTLDLTNGYSGSVILNSGTLIANQNFLLKGATVMSGVGSGAATLNGTLTLGISSPGVLNLQDTTFTLSPTSVDQLPPVFNATNLTLDLNSGVLFSSGATFILEYSLTDPTGALPVYNVAFAPEPPASLLLGSAVTALAFATRRRFLNLDA